MKRIRLGFDFFQPDAVDSAVLMQCFGFFPLESRWYGTPSSKAHGEGAKDIIAVAQSRAAYLLTCEELGVSAGFEIERALLGDAYGPDDERPRWWVRLQKGSLRLVPALNRQDPDAMLRIPALILSVVRLKIGSLSDWMLAGLPIHTLAKCG